MVVCGTFVSPAVLVNLSPYASSLLARLAKLHGQRNPLRDTVIAAYVSRRVAYAVRTAWCWSSFSSLTVVIVVALMLIAYFHLTLVQC